MRLLPCKCAPVPVLFLRDLLGCSAVVVSLGVVLFVRCSSVPFPSPHGYPDRDLVNKNQGISKNGRPSGMGMTFPRFSGAPSSAGPPRDVTLRGFPGRAMILAAAPPKADGFCGGHLWQFVGSLVLALSS